MLKSPAGRYGCGREWVALLQKARRNRPDPAAHRFLGGVRRKSRAHRRAVAYLGSGSILPGYGNSLDHPIETIGKMDRERALA
jgi:hypothetical protein